MWASETRPVAAKKRRAIETGPLQNPSFSCNQCLLKMMVVDQTGCWKLKRPDEIGKTANVIKEPVISGIIVSTESQDCLSVEEPEFK